MAPSHLVATSRRSWVRERMHAPRWADAHAGAVNARHRGDKAVCDAVAAFVAKHGTAVLWTDELLGDGR